MGTAAVLAGLVILIAATLFIERIIHNAALQNEQTKLQVQQKQLESSIADLKQQEEQKPPEQTPQEIADYWNKK